MIRRTASATLVARTATRLATRRVVEAARLARALAALDAEVGDGGGGVAASESVRERCEASVVSASDGGALTALRSALQTVSFQDDDDASRRSYLDLAHAVALRAVRAMLERPALGEALAAVEIPMTRAQVEREERLAMLERAMDAEAEAEAGRRAEAADAARSSRARNDASGGGAGFYYEYDDDRYDARRATEARTAATTTTRTAGVTPATTSAAAGRRRSARASSRSRRRRTRSGSPR